MERELADVSTAKDKGGRPSGLGGPEGVSAPASSVLSLQRAIGNRAVAAALEPPPPPKSVIQRELSPSTRAEITTIVSGLGAPLLIVPLRLLGFQVTGFCVGLRGSGTAAAGVAGSLGVDGMAFVDPVNWEITGDVVPWGEVGVGMREGASGGIVVGLRLSPVGRYGAARDSYEGGSIGGTVRALAGIGLSVGTGFLSREEFWATAVFSLGMEAGASASYSRGVSGVNLTRNAAAGISTMADSIGGLVTGAVAVASGIGSAIQSMFTEVFAIFDPTRWNLRGYTDAERTAFRNFGALLTTAISSQSLDAFLRAENTRVPVSRRIGIESVGTLIMVSEAINARAERDARAAGRPSPGRQIEPVEFNTITYLEFLRRAMDNGWFSLTAPPTH